MQIFCSLGNGLTLLGMLDILAVDCNTIETRQQVKQANEQEAEEQCCTNNSNTNPVVTDNNSTLDYFLPGLNKGGDRRAGAKIIKQMREKLPNLFSGTGCFKGTFSLQV